MLLVRLLLLFLTMIRPSRGFVPFSARIAGSLLRRSMADATASLQELSSDPFIKQVSHSEEIVAQLSKNPTDVGLQDRLTAILSHSDGIRGFMVTYLTTVNSPADCEEVPSCLAQALKQSDPDDLIPLACMNVVMPTAMITMHKDRELSQQSRITAERGLRVLSFLRNEESTAERTKDNCQAILSAANEERISEPGERHKFWVDFIQKWGYEGLQKRDIVQAMRSALE